jgi:hypothetical protein
VTPIAAADSKFVYYEPVSSPRFNTSSAKGEQSRSSEYLHALPNQAVTFPIDGTPSGAAGATSKLPRTLQYAGAVADKDDAVFKTPRAPPPISSRVNDAGSRIPQPTAAAGEGAADERRVQHAVSAGSLDCGSSKVPSRIPTRATARKQSDA